MGYMNTIHRVGSSDIKLLLHCLLLSVLFKSVSQGTASEIFFCSRTPIHLHQNCVHSFSYCNDGLIIVQIICNEGTLLTGNSYISSVNTFYSLDIKLLSVLSVKLLSVQFCTHICTVIRWRKLINSFNICLWKGSDFKNTFRVALTYREMSKQLLIGGVLVLQFQGWTIPC